MQFVSLLLMVGTAVAVPAPQTTPAKCDPATAAQVAQLSQGIQANLDIQAQELAGIQMLQALEANSTTRSANFQTSQQSTLAIQQQGINIRAQNQKIAMAINSPSQQGLAIVSQAQVMEMTQVQGLQGTAQADRTTLLTLVKEVQDGTKQNQMNLAMAQSQCK